MGLPGGHYGALHERLPFFLPDLAPGLSDEMQHSAQEKQTARGVRARSPDTSLTHIHPTHLSGHKRQWLEDL